MDEKDYITIKRASELLGVDKTTLRRWDKAGKLTPKRHPINKYRMYDKNEVLRLLSEIQIADKSNIQRCFHEYIILFNEEMNNSLFNYFKSEEINDKINKKDHGQKIYLKMHFIKTFNLLFSILTLCSGGKNRILPDEAKIVFRSLFEHIMNFLYIFTRDTNEETNKLIKRFDDFTNIALNRYFIDYKSDWNNGYIDKNEKQKLIHKQVEETYKNLKLGELVSNYKEKYETRSINEWHGLKMHELMRAIGMKTNLIDELRFYKKYYVDANCYVHCNVMDYMNDDGVIVGNNRLEESLEITHKCLFLVLGYVEIFYELIDINIKEKYPKIYEKFDTISDNYHKIMRGINHGK